MEHRTAFDVIARLAQAQGIVSAQAGCSLDEALQIMRERAQVEHRTVTEIADAVLDRTISFGAAAE
jgi:AmiR/NasT family two-component response regulator